MSALTIVARGVWSGVANDGTIFMTAIWDTTVARPAFEMSSSRSTGNHASAIGGCLRSSKLGHSALLSAKLLVLRRGRFVMAA